MIGSISQLLEIILPVVTSIIGLAGASFLKFVFDKKLLNEEKTEIKSEVQKVEEISRVSDNVLEPLVNNIKESREYYVINKQQARNSFSSTLLISVFGFILFSIGLVFYYKNPENSNFISYSAVGGAITEIVAGLFFWIYNKAITQINIFHASLQVTEKFLTAIQLVEKMSSEKRD